MKLKLSIILAAILFSVSLHSLYAQHEIPSEIVYAIKTGNAGKLVTFFNSQIEIQIKNKEDIYSLAQAEIILKDFFSKNKPSSFEIIHQGGQEKSQYAIGKLLTENGDFRTYIFLKSIGTKKRIYQLRFEDDDE